MSMPIDVALQCADDLEMSSGTERTLAAEVRRLREELRKATEWQPIETAPENIPIDVWRSEWRERVCNVVKIDRGNGNVFFAGTTSGPTCIRDASHWMPLPEPPK